MKVKVEMECSECSEAFASTGALNDHLQVKHSWTLEEVAAGFKAFEVSRVIEHRCVARKKEFHVEWVGYDETTWVQESQLNDSFMLREYKSSHGIGRSRKISAQAQPNGRERNTSLRCSTSSQGLDREEDEDVKPLVSFLGKSPIDCTECNKTFTTKKALNVHLRVEHNWTSKEVAAGSKSYEVDSIIDHRCVGQKLEFHVKWVGYDEATWVSEKSLGAGPLLRKYKASKGIRKTSSSISSYVQDTDDEGNSVIIRAIVGYTYDPLKKKKTTFEVETEPNGDTVTMTVQQLTLVDAYSMDEFLNDSNLMRISEDGTIVKVDCAPCSVCRQDIPLRHIEKHLVQKHKWNERKLTAHIHVLRMESIEGHVKFGSTTFFEVKRAGSKNISYLSTGYFKAAEHIMLRKYAARKNLSPLLLAEGANLDMRVRGHISNEGIVDKLVAHCEEFDHQKYRFAYENMVKVAPRVVLNYWRTTVKKTRRGRTEKRDRSSKLLF